jgi:hypothetical protein
LAGPSRAILVAYDVMEVDGHTCALRLWRSEGSAWRLLSRKTKAMRDGIQMSEALTGIEAPSSATPAVWVSKALSRSAPARDNLIG